jgi:hypothetical protein
LIGCSRVGAAGHEKRWVIEWVEDKQPGHKSSAALLSLFFVCVEIFAIT